MKAFLKTQHTETRLGNVPLDSKREERDHYLSKPIFKVLGGKLKIREIYSRD